MSSGLVVFECTNLSNILPGMNCASRTTDYTRGDIGVGAVIVMGGGGDDGDDEDDDGKYTRFSWTFKVQGRAGLMTVSLVSVASAAGCPRDKWSSGKFKECGAAETDTYGVFFAAPPAGHLKYQAVGAVAVGEVSSNYRGSGRGGLLIHLGNIGLCFPSPDLVFPSPNHA